MSLSFPFCRPSSSCDCPPCPVLSSFSAHFQRLYSSLSACSVRFMPNPPSFISFASLCLPVVSSPLRSPPSAPALPSIGRPSHLPPPRPFTCAYPFASLSRCAARHLIAFVHSNVLTSFRSITWRPNAFHVSSPQFLTRLGTLPSSLSSLFPESSFSAHLHLLRFTRSTHCPACLHSQLSLSQTFLCAGSAQFLRCGACKPRFFSCVLRSRFVAAQVNLSRFPPNVSALFLSSPTQHTALPRVVCVPLSLFTLAARCLPPVFSPSAAALSRTRGLFRRGQCPFMPLSLSHSVHLRASRSSGLSLLSSLSSFYRRPPLPAACFVSCAIVPSS
ncbi:hypothetical protein TRVL_08078 [Trypanosoma vivax]|nr:hypothetical protein TRVL_08078 [Trypanosoma vivax]